MSTPNYSLELKPRDPVGYVSPFNEVNSTGSQVPTDIISSALKDINESVSQTSALPARQVTVAPLYRALLNRIPIIKKICAANRIRHRAKEFITSYTKSGQPLPFDEKAFLKNIEACIKDLEFSDLQYIETSISQNNFFLNNMAGRITSEQKIAIMYIKQTAEKICSSIPLESDKELFTNAIHQAINFVCLDLTPSNFSEVKKSLTKIEEILYNMELSLCGTMPNMPNVESTRHSEEAATQRQNQLLLNQAEINTLNQKILTYTQAQKIQYGYKRDLLNAQENIARMTRELQTTLHKETDFKKKYPSVSENNITNLKEFLTSQRLPLGETSVDALTRLDQEIKNLDLKMDKTQTDINDKLKQISNLNPLEFLKKSELKREIQNLEDTLQANLNSSIEKQVLVLNIKTIEEALELISRIENETAIALVITNQIRSNGRDCNDTNHKLNEANTRLMELTTPSSSQPASPSEPQPANPIEKLRLLAAAIVRKIETIDLNQRKRKELDRTIKEKINELKTKLQITSDEEVKLSELKPSLTDKYNSINTDLNQLRENYQNLLLKQRGDQLQINSLKALSEKLLLTEKHNKLTVLEKDQKDFLTSLAVLEEEQKILQASINSDHDMMVLKLREIKKLTPQLEKIQECLSLISSIETDQNDIAQLPDESHLRLATYNELFNTMDNLAKLGQIVKTEIPAGG